MYASPLAKPLNSSLYPPYVDTTSAAPSKSSPYEASPVIRTPSKQNNNNDYYGANNSMEQTEQYINFLKEENSRLKEKLEYSQISQQPNPRQQTPSHFSQLQQTPQQSQNQLFKNAENDDTHDIPIINNNSGGKLGVSTAAALAGKVDMSNNTLVNASQSGGDSLGQKTGGNENSFSKHNRKSPQKSLYPNQFNPTYQQMQYSKLLTEFTILKNEYEKLENDSESQKNNARRQIERLSTEKKALEEDKKSLKDANQKLKSEIEKTNADKGEQSTKYSAKSAQYQSEIKKLKSQMKSLKSQIENINDQLAKTKSEKNDSQKQNDELTKKLNEIQSENEVLKTSNTEKKLQSKIKKQKTQIDAMSKDLDNIRIENESMKSSVIDLKTQLNQKNESADAIKVKYDEMQSKIDSLRSQVLSLEKQKTEALNLYAKGIDEMKELKGQFSSMQIELDDRNEQIGKYTDQKTKKRQMSKEIQSLRSTNEQQAKKIRVMEVQIEHLKEEKIFQEKLPSTSPLKIVPSTTPPYSPSPYLFNNSYSNINNNNNNNNYNDFKNSLGSNDFNNNNSNKIGTPINNRPNSYYEANNYNNNNLNDVNENVIDSVSGNDIGKPGQNAAPRENTKHFEELSQKIDMLTDKFLEDNKKKTKQLDNMGKTLSTLTNNQSAITKDIEVIRNQFNGDYSSTLNSLNLSE